MDFNDYHNNYHDTGEHDLNDDINIYNYTNEYDNTFFAPYTLLVFIVIGCSNTIYQLCKVIVRDRRDKHKITQLTKKIKKNDLDNLINECSICLEEFKLNEIVITLPCSHTYHKKCMEPWLKDNNNCPLCRVSI